MPKAAEKKAPQRERDEFYTLALSTDERELLDAAKKASGRRSLADWMLSHLLPIARREISRNSTKS